MAEAVVRTTFSSGCKSSGLLIKPCDTCKAQFSVGLKDNLPLQLSKRGLSKLYRFSSGSLPVKEEPSIFQLPYLKPMEATPKVTCVASTQCWEMGTYGSANAH